MIKRHINQQDFKTVNFHLSNLNNFHSLEVVDRVSETQFQVGENSNWIKWNESGFRPPLCTYRLNWTRRTSWGWWDEWNATVLQTQDSKLEPWRSKGRARYLSVTEAPHNTEFHTWMGKKHVVSFKPPRPWIEPRTLAWKAAVLTTTIGPPPSNWITRRKRGLRQTAVTDHFTSK